MALRLRVVSDHRRLLGERSTVTFEAGCSIGRSADNDWVLPDAQRYISAHHARIHRDSDGYVLEDLSTNGVFVNDDAQALGRRGAYRLRSGDVLRLGEYQVVVAIEAEAAAGPTPFVPDAVPTRIEVLQGIGRVGQTDIGASLRLDQLLVADGATDDSLRVVNAYGQAVTGPRRTAAPSALAAAAGVEDMDEAAVARRIERMARATSRARGDSRSAAAAPSLSADAHSGIQSFCRGAGISAAQLPADAHGRLLHLAGQLLREALVGLKDMERARHEIRSRLRIELPAEDPDDPHPSLARSATVEELLTDVLTQHETRQIDAVQWLRGALEAAKAHERASAQALRAAFVEFIDRFDPAELEARFQRAARRGSVTGSGQTRYWTLFTEFYRSLTEMPPDELPHVFVEAFAAAYRDSVKKPD